MREGRAPGGIDLKVRTLKGGADRFLIDVIASHCTFKCSTIVYSRTTVSTTTRWACQVTRLCIQQPEVSNPRHSHPNWLVHIGAGSGSEIYALLLLSRHQLTSTKYRRSAPSEIYDLALMVIILDRLIAISPFLTTAFVRVHQGFQNILP
jgi:hypothetical protein